MKKIKMLFMFMLVLFAIVGNCFAIEKILNVPIDNIEYLPITVPEGYKVDTYGVQTRSGSVCYVKKSLSDTTFLTIKEDSGMVLPTRIVGRVKVLGYVKSSVASDVLEVICVNVK
ncbi:MAG: hypothetical protein GY797_01565 [Deltaproteobacteria bacterium]|nr:hypothetical protein [Deltaproteobacteria bacterium]